MTKEQKAEWLRNATVDEVLGQYRRAIGESINGRDIAIKVGADEDIRLIEAELKRRIGK